MSCLNLYEVICHRQEPFVMTGRGFVLSDLTGMAGRATGGYAVLEGCVHDYRLMPGKPGRLLRKSTHDDKACDGVALFPITVGTCSGSSIWVSSRASLYPAVSPC